MSSDSQAMGRVGEVPLRTWQTALPRAARSWRCAHEAVAASER